MFESTHPFPLFDYFRVPYAHVPELLGSSPGGCAWLRRSDQPDGPRLFWPPAETAGLELAAELRLEGLTLFARVVPDTIAAPWLRELGGEWSSLPITDPDGRRIASIRRDARGNVFLPFAPEEAISNCLSEAYNAIGQPSSARAAKRLALRLYYAIRPALPRRVQIALRRTLARVQVRRAFPAWPYETSLHDLYDLVLRLVASVAGEPVPTIASWPSGYDWAFVLTHDVEQQLGFDNIDRLRSIEQAAGYRSSWNFVPRRYEIDDAVVADLVRDGFEVGVHGLYHDGRDLESEELLLERLPAIQEAAGRWSAVGFRSPATHRQWDLMPLLDFDYDSSSPDSDPFEPYGGGCCSWLPFFNRDLVELPITLVQDHTLFVILRKESEAPWVEKTEFLRSRQGLALLITHPDYMLDEARLGAYTRLLERFLDDETMWRALPREVSAWWRRRAASVLVREGGAWRIEGPGSSEGRIRFVLPEEAAQAA